jgi:hypothetical protein
MDTNRILENDPDYQRFTQTCDAEHQAAMEAAPLEPIEVTIKRATGQDVVSISIYDPDKDAKLRAIYGTWGAK